MAAKRVTVTLDESLVHKAKKLSGRNFSRFVNESVKDRVEAIRRNKLREDIIAGCIANAEEDLEVCREWEAIDCEMGLRVAP